MQSSQNQIRYVRAVQLTRLRNLRNESLRVHNVCYRGNRSIETASRTSLRRATSQRDKCNLAGI